MRRQHYGHHNKQSRIFGQQPQQSAQPSMTSMSDMFDFNNEYQNSQHQHQHQMTSPSRQNDTPVINQYSDSITLTNENFKPNKTLINLSGFDELAPFVGTDKSYTLNSTTDNRYNDYNEGGPNNINESDYRQRLIRQMQQSVFQQSESMFGRSERVAQPRQSSRRGGNGNSDLIIPNYDVANTYTPSNVQSIYLQQQSKKLFKNIEN